MENQDRALCAACARPIEETVSVCPHCGHILPAQNPSPLLPVGVLLQQRFWVGLALSQNGEGVTYIGCDLQENRTVWVREFFPQRLACRVDGSHAIMAQEGCTLAYKSLLSDFGDIHRMVSRLGEGGHVLEQTALFQENGTYYAVYLPPQAVPLADYLKENGGILSLPEAKRLILQVCTAAGSVHQQGYIHGGLSPSTIYLDEDGVVYLSGFATMPLRTDKTEIEEELFPGYSAPEQYSLNSWQGSWTDVYAIGALFYQMLAGNPPPDGSGRRIVDTIRPLAQVNDAIPENISLAVQSALVIQPEKRLQTVDAFTAALLRTGGDGGTAVFDPAKSAVPVEEEGSTMAFQPMSALTSEEKINPKKPVKKRRGKFLALALVLGVASICLFGRNGQTDTPPRVPVPDPHYVPPLVGMYIDAVTSNTAYETQFFFSQRHIYNETYPAGVVVDQAPDPGVKMLHKGTVILYVSMGSQRTTMPNLVGNPVEEARSKLASANILYQVVETEEYEPGVVGMTSIGAGSVVRKESDVVYLYVGKTKPPEETSSPSSGEASEPESSSSSEEE